MDANTITGNEVRCGKIFGLGEWMAWLDHMAKSLFGISGAQFEIAYEQGAFNGSGVADDIASILPLIRDLRDGK